MDETQTLPVRHDLSAAVGEKCEFCVEIDGDIDLDFAVAHYAVKEDSSDGDVVKSGCLNFFDGKAFFELSSAETKTMGEGLFYYDLWLKDGDDMIRPVVYGQINLVKLPTKGGCR